MKAARFYTAKDLRVDEVPLEEPKGDEVRIKVKFCGICGSDIHEYEDGPIFTPGTTPQYVTGCVNPVTMGHEFSGVVDAVGPDVTKFKVGDRVRKGDTLCIIEAMKLMNEITADQDGEIAEICAVNGQVVEYGSELFRLKR